MKQPHRTLIALGLGAALALPALAADEGKIVIAHRGASGYLPEHTLNPRPWPMAWAPTIWSRTW
jgi:glycerophosphoryl diester phosphodiesterase